MYRVLAKIGFALIVLALFAIFGDNNHSRLALIGIAYLPFALCVMWCVDHFGFIRPRKRRI